MGGECDIRVLIDKGGRVVDLVVDHNEEILLRVVGSNFLEGKFLRHVESGGVVDVGVECKRDLVVVEVFVVAFGDFESQESKCGRIVIARTGRIWDLVSHFKFVVRKNSDIEMLRL